MVLAKPMACVFRCLRVKEYRRRYEIYLKSSAVMLARQRQHNIIEIYHQRMFFDVPAKLAKIDAIVETRGPAHAHQIINDLRTKGFVVRLMEEGAGG